jgi:preprotein translocase subunit SecA
MVSFLSKLFGGNKSEKDIKTIMPKVEQINQFQAAYISISNDALRAKTDEFKLRIKEHLQEIDNNIADLGKKAEELPFSDISGKDVLYIEIDELKKKRDDLIEEVLDSILPEAFAVVKETARRFKENTQVVTTANNRDKELSVIKDYVKIDGENAVYSNSWMAAGGAITWNMIHYDVQ